MGQTKISMNTSNRFFPNMALIILKCHYKADISWSVYFSDYYGFNHVGVWVETRYHVITSRTRQCRIWLQTQDGRTLLRAILAKMEVTYSCYFLFGKVNSYCFLFFLSLTHYVYFSMHFFNMRHLKMILSSFCTAYSC